MAGGAEKTRELTGAQVLVRTLIDQGVDTVFGYPGGTVLEIFDVLMDHADQLRLVEPTHEQHGCHAADGYARATGRCGVVIATSGPGATNLVTGIATAFLDSIPLVAVTGNVSNAMIGTDAFQELDITGVTLPITKHNYFVRDASRLQEVLREAFELALSGRRGPVLVDVPADVQRALVPFEELPPVGARPPLEPSDEALRAAADAINASERPFVYFGGGAVASEAGEQVVSLARRIGAPIGCSLMGVSGIPTRTEGFLGMEGMHGHAASTQAMSACDCLIALGVRFNDRSTGDRATYAPSGRVVHVDVDSSEFSKTLEDRVEVQGDVRLVLERLLPLVTNATHEAWDEQVSELVARERAGEDRREGLTPQNVMAAINRRRPAQVPVVTDVGQHQMWAAQGLAFSRPRTFISSGGLGTMGFGLGAAIGAALGTRGPAILVTGDGSFAMNLAELITAADNDLPVVVVLLNNGVLGMVRQMQSLFKRSRHAATTIAHKADFIAMARAAGAAATRVASVGEFEEALARALAQDGPTLIECPIDPDEFVTPVLRIGASMDELIVTMDDVQARMGR
ncbi:biosynthetic-type acetolactate synthase large subunit [Olsenella massiliensis]|uniref:biosynthetic-type acetolactate synthase large subunit n=1 Tax=Olsenella massiliensis TaxID=1622075 RepID=UPI00071C8914|nr:biosynthetic-type acetolactate synthase large subunit [Olsenella massiliensis]